MSAFFVRIHEATEGIFLVTFFCLVNLVTFFVFLLKNHHRIFVFPFFRQKEKKQNNGSFFTFLLMIPSCKLCFDDFFSLFVRLFVWFVVTPGKQ